jgi:hypothetical protein
MLHGTINLVMKPIISKLLTLSPGVLLGIVSLIYALLYLPTLDIMPQVAMDEGWNALYAAQEFNLLPYAELKTIIQYKLFFVYYLLAFPFLKIFGISLWSIRFFAFTCGLAGLFGIHKISTYLKWPPLARIAAYGAYIFSNISLVIFHWGRPEALLTVGYVFFVYFLLKGTIDNNKLAWFSTGFLSVGLVMSHPFSVIIGVPLGCLLIARLIKKDYTPLVYVVLGTLPLLCVFSINAFYINWDYTNQLFIGHITDRLSITSHTSLVDRAILFFNHYTLGIKRLYIFVFEVGILCYGLLSKKSSQATKTISFFGLAMFITGLLVFSPFRRRYFCLIAINSILVLGDVIKNISFSKQRKIAFIIIIGLFFGNTMAGDAYYIYKNYRNTPYRQLTHSLQNLGIPKTASILSPIHFWLPFHNYYAISNVHHFPGLGYPSYQDLLDKKDIDYILTAPYLLNNNSPTTGQKSTVHQMNKSPFLLALKTYTETHCELISSVTAPPYGTLFLYKTIKNK